jgi:hypothetical protein
MLVWQITGEFVGVASMGPGPTVYLLTKRSRCVDKYGIITRAQHTIMIIWMNNHG